MDRRKQWVVSSLVAVAVAALVATAVLSGGGGEESCEEWQERYEAAMESMGIEPGTMGTLQFINMGPFAELEESRPEGCERPA